MEGKENQEPKRFIIYNERGEIIGQDYQRDNGEWMHKWILRGEFERGSWRGRCSGENQNKWTYKEVNREL